MKSTRHAMILQLVQSEAIETQDELVARLRDRGLAVTQATISRDIKELRLIKVMGAKGKYQYASVEQEEDGLSQRLIEIFSRSVLSITSAGNIIVIKVISGSANVAGEAIDTLHWAAIAGSIAGDNTLFVAVHDDYDVQSVVRDFRNLYENSGSHRNKNKLHDPEE